MNPINMIQSLMNAEKINATPVSFKPGQLLYGKIEKLLGNDTAIVQIGNTRVFAQLKASLSTSDHYWFEVQGNGVEGIQLTVVEGLEKTKQQLESAAAWLPKEAGIKELAALDWMLNKNLPFTELIFQSLVAFQESETFYSQLKNLRNLLDNPKFTKLESIQQLKQLLSNILIHHPIDELGSGAIVKDMLQSMIHKLGLDYESGIIKNQDSLNSLKPLLMKALEELGSNGKELEPILNRLTGMQLHSQDSTGPAQQIVMQLPITYGEKQSDITIQWNGRKNSKGQIDPDYCRILFYLDLQSLHETVIEMQIQNRIIHANIINDSKDVEPIISAMTPILREKLESLGYKLSFVKVSGKMDFRQTNPDVFTNEFYRGVDIKV